MSIFNENKKIFIFLFFVAMIIILGVIWLPEKDVTISQYVELSELDVDNKVSKQYGDELLYAFYSGNGDALQTKALPSFLEYINISTKDYQNWLKENGLDTYNIKFGNTTKYEYNDTNIYSISAVFDEIEKNINIIEKSPEEWYYTVGSFVDFDADGIKQIKDNYGVIINSIYQDLEYLEMECSLYVANDGYNDIDMIKSDSVKLNLDDKSAFIMATNNVNSNEFVLNNKKYVNFKCIFNIPITLQDSIVSIDFNAFYVNGERVSINVKWSK